MSGWDTTRALYPPVGGREVKADNTLFDVPAWRESVDNRLSALQTSLGGIVSTDNSSTDAIADGANFTGAWEDCSPYQSLVVAVKTDQKGYYEIQFSPDAVNIDSTLTRYYHTTTIEPPHRFTVTRRYFRIVFYNNSGTNQTYFRMQVLLGLKCDLNIPLDSTMAQDFDAVATRPSDYSTEVALGRRANAVTWNKFGYNLTVGITAEVVASWGGAFQFLTTGETLDIVSSSANDTSGGTGARQVIVQGVDENWDTQNEIVTLNGTTTVTTSTLWLGINRVAVYLAGSSMYNEGTIDVTAATSGYTLAQMTAQQGTTQQCVFYIPHKHQFLSTYLRLSGVKSSGGGNPEILFIGYVYSAVSNSKYEIFREDVDTSLRDFLYVDTTEPFVVGEKSILWFEATSSAASTSVKGRFGGKLIKDADA